MSSPGHDLLRSPDESLSIIGFGAGGHAQAVMEALKLSTNYEVKALLTADSGSGDGLLAGVPVLPESEHLARLLDEGIARAFVGIGGICDNEPRKRVAMRARQAGLEIIGCVHPTAFVSPSAQVGTGIQFMARTVVHCSATIGDDTIVNTGAIVEHDCSIGSNVHLAPGSILGGSVEAGDDCHVGIGAIVLQGIRLGGSCVVGAGAVVTCDVEVNSTVVGVPARVR